MPIKARIDMLTTGIRTPIGIKVFGTDLFEINKIGEQLEGILKMVPGTRSVYAEREIGGFFIDFIPDREAIARYGLRLMDVFDVIETAIGGLDVSTTIEGRERYKINVRYPRDLRNDVEIYEMSLSRFLNNKMDKRGNGRQTRNVWRESGTRAFSSSWKN